MSYLAHRKEFGHFRSYHDTCASPARSVIKPKERSSIKVDEKSRFRRLVERLFEPRHKQLDREMGNYLLRSGGRLTDNLEREMMQHLTTSNWGRR